MNAPSTCSGKYHSMTEGHSPPWKGEIWTNDRSPVKMCTASCDRAERELQRCRLYTVVDLPNDIVTTA